ncbi:MAG: PQQ-binding-like beta-propeller repeat protein [Vicinamibacteria bacterium]
MRRRSFLAGLAATAVPSRPAAAADDAASGRAPFAVCDYTQGRVFLIGADGAPVWSHDAPDTNDLWALPDGNLLFTTGHGVVEVTRAKEVVFRYDSPEEIYACQRLPNGNTFVGECTSGRLLEVDRSGRVVKETRLLPAGRGGGHAFMRNARALPGGRFLVAHYESETVREYDAAGRVVWEAKAPGGAHSVARLPSGRTLVATADRDRGEPRFLEIERDGRVSWQLTNDDLPGRPLRFLGGFHRLANGHTVLTNWLGHGHVGDAPLLLEVTPDKKVVWTYERHDVLRTASSVVVLDPSGRAPAGPIVH